MYVPLIIGYLIYSKGLGSFDMKFIIILPLVGEDLGLDCDPTHFDLPPMNPLSGSQKKPEDYVFVHTDSHREFMDLLLEKRKKLENSISSKEIERRNKEVLDAIKRSREDVKEEST